MRPMLPVLSLVALLGIGCSHGRSGPSESTTIVAQREVAGAVMLVRTPRHLQAAIETAGQLRTQDPRFRQFRVLVCGEAVLALKAGGELEPLLSSAREQAIRVTACGLSLKELEVDPATISKQVEIIPNALAEVLRMQADGWISVEL